MECKSVSQDLTNNLMEASDFVHSVLQQANNQHNLLKEKAQQLKNQIQNDVSLHLELLRNREVWLLDQVDLLLQLKEELMESQQKEVFVLLAKLEVYLQLIKTTNVEESAEFKVQATELITRVKHLNLDEDPDIGFLVNNSGLADEIKNFGCIAEEATGKKLATGQKRYDGTSPNVSALMNLPVQDWLVPSSICYSEEKLNQRPLTGFEKFYKELIQSDNKNWLHREGQSFDRKTSGSDFSEFFDEVMQAPMVDWLTQDSATIVTNDHPLRFRQPYCKGVRQENWLLTTEQSDCRSAISGEENMQGNMCVDEADIIVEDGWLLSRKGTKDVYNPVKSEKCSADWLLPECTMSSSEETTQDNEWLFEKFRNSLKMSNNSDWLIQSKVEPEYCDWLSHDSTRCKDCPGDCPRESMKVFRDILNSSRDEWLKTVVDW